MKNTISIGDAVRPIRELAVVERRDMKNRLNMFAEVVPAWHPSVSRPACGQPTVLDALVGVYLGTEYISIADRRSMSGTSQSLQHSFLFGSRRVFVQPSMIEVIAAFDTTEG